MTDKSAEVVPIRPGGPRAPSRHGSSNPDSRAFGERLRHSREQRRLSLQQIANSTKIGIHLLRALERGDFRALPAGIYGRSMIRQYAKAIGVSPEETLREFAGVSTESDLQPQTPTEVTDEGSMGFSAALWMSAAAVCILGTIAASMAVGWYRSTSAAVTSPKDVPVGAAAGDIELSPDPAVIEVINTGGAVDAPTTEGELRIVSDPAGAQVTVNGIRWDATPLTIRYLPFGEQLIRVTKTGYASEQRSVELAPDRPVRSVRIELSPVN